MVLLSFNLFLAFVQIILTFILLGKGLFQNEQVTSYRFESIKTLSMSGVIMRWDMNAVFFCFFGQAKFFIF